MRERPGLAQRRIRNVFGYLPEDVASDLNWWIERIHPDDRDRVLAQIAELHSATSQQCAFEYRFRRADGTLCRRDRPGFVMYDEADRPVRMVGSIMDISARRRAEEMVNMHQAELAHIVAREHDGRDRHRHRPRVEPAADGDQQLCRELLRRPWRRMRRTPSRRCRQWIEKIATNTHRAGEMIRRLRCFTRKSECRREPVEVGELVREVIDLLEPKRAVATCGYAARRGEVPQVVVDRMQIQQVLVNLLRNAYDAMADMPPERRSGDDRHRAARACGANVRVGSRAEASRRKRATRCSMRSSPPSPTAWASGWPSAARSSKITAAGCG